MPVAIDTSVLIEAERLGSIEALLPRGETGPFYIPTYAAGEFLIGTHPPLRDDLRYRAILLYQGQLQQLVDDFTEADAAQLAARSADLKRRGHPMKFFDAAIAAFVMARGDKLLTADSALDRLGKQITLLKL